MAPLPVYLITGFLGSGKTTLLARLLRDQRFADTAVVVNELGEVGLDHVLVGRGSEDGIVTLDSGCLCCALGNSLQETLEDLHYRRVRGGLPPFTRVIVETTGVADPGPIAATLALDWAIARHYRLGGIVTTVDAVHGADQLNRFPEAVRQVAFADRVIVTKSDLADTATTAALLSRLDAINPHADRMTAIAGAVQAADVLANPLVPATFGPASGASDAQSDRDARRLDHEVWAQSGSPHDHLGAQGIATIAIRLDAPLDWPRYADWVAWAQATLGDGILRVKGLVRMEDGAAYALHAVMRLFSAPAELPDIPAALGYGRVILITQNVPSAVLEEARRRLAGARGAAPALSVP